MIEIEACTSASIWFFSPDAYNVKELSLPAFPLDVVREVVIEALDMAAEVNQLHNRDPIGGSNEDLFVPLIKILDKLLLCGALGNEDIEHLLVLIHPATWDRYIHEMQLNLHFRFRFRSIISCVATA